MRKYTKKLSQVFLAMFVCLSLGTATAALAQATPIDPSINVAGTDNSANLGSVNNVGTTIISFMINVVARVVGVGLAVFAIMQLVKREVVWGVVNFVLCGVCFFLPNIILGISKMG